MKPLRKRARTQNEKMIFAGTGISGTWLIERFIGDNAAVVRFRNMEQAKQSGSVAVLGRKRPATSVFIRNDRLCVGWFDPDNTFFWIDVDSGPDLKYRLKRLENSKPELIRIHYASLKRAHARRLVIQWICENRPVIITCNPDEKPECRILDRLAFAVECEKP